MRSILIILFLCLSFNSSITYADRLLNPGGGGGQLIGPGQQNPGPPPQGWVAINPLTFVEDRTVLPPPNPLNPPREAYRPRDSSPPTGPVDEIKAVTTGTCDSSKAGFTKVDKLNLFYCDGKEWQVVILEATVKACASAQTGKYSLTAEKKLEFCNGLIWLATGDKIVEACSSNLLGKMKFSSSSTQPNSKVLQFCNGENWLDTTQRQKEGGPPMAMMCKINDEFNPVCGQDNVLYKNGDHARCFKTEVAYMASPYEIKRGICEPYKCNPSPDVIQIYCGSNGAYYYSQGCSPFNVPGGVTLKLGFCN